MSKVSDDEKLKLKSMIAFSRDILLVSLEEKIIQILIEDTRIKETFIEYSGILIKRVKNEIRKTLEAIDKDVNYDALNTEGLVGSELNFKYAFFNSLISNANDPESYSPYNLNQPFPNLPDLDTYTNNYIENPDESPKLTEIREFILSLSSVGGWVKKKVGKVVVWVLNGTNTYWDSVNTVLPYLGAVKEIKGLLELGIDAAGSLKGDK